MGRVDMSAKAVTARLRLVSDLRDLCLLLGKAQIEQEPGRKTRAGSKRKSTRKKKSK